MSARRHQSGVPWILWPFWAIWRLIAFIVGMTGRLIAVVLGIVFGIIGLVLTATVVLSPIGIPLLLFGALLIIRGLF